MPEAANYKRIIVCCDGTWMAANTGDTSTPSNVAKIARAIAPHAVVDGKIVTQVVSYNAGLGSTSLPFAKAIEGKYRILCPLSNMTSSSDMMLTSFQEV